MKLEIIRETLKNKSLKKEFALITNLINGESEIFFPGHNLSEMFSKYSEEIEKIFNLNNITKTNILAASIRNVDHINDSYRAGADIVTLPPKIFEEMYKHVLTDQGLAQFDKDWKELNK